MEKDEIIVTIIAAVLGSGVLNGIITHFLYNNKLKKEQRMKVKDIIWGKVDNALEAIRDIELKTRARNIFDFESTIIESEYTDFQNGVPVYPEIMSDSQTFYKFFMEINGARGEWSKYLDTEVGAYLYYMEIYCMQLMEYLSKNGLVNSYQLAGYIFFEDILEWQRNYEKLIVKRLNKSKYKIYTESGRQWTRAKKKVDKKLRKKSILYQLINDVDSNKIRKIKRIFSESICNNQSEKKE